MVLRLERRPSERKSRTVDDPFGDDTHGGDFEEYGSDGKRAGFRGP